MRILLYKSRACNTTRFLGAFDKKVLSLFNKSFNILFLYKKEKFVGNTNLLKISEENGKLK